ncbi:MAG: cyclic nucleotide-binding domain-containing protein [bacterium]|nr:cyclic nucleotide-binding domain-containing protein [bacterium]
MLNGFKHLVGKKAKEDTQLKSYQEALEKNPENVNIRLKLGDHYAKLDEKVSAIREYTSAAIQYADDGYLVKAIAVNKIIVRLDPSRQEALDRLSDLYFQRGIAADPLVQSYREAHQETTPSQEPEHAEEIPPSSSLRDEEFSEELPSFDLTEEEQPTADRSAEIASYVKDIPLFAQLADENRQFLQKHAQLRRLQTDESLFKGEPPPESLFVVLRGTVTLYTKDKEQHDTLLDTLEVGNFFGGLSLFAPVRQNPNDSPENNLSATAQCKGCLVLEVPKSVLAALAKRESELSDTLLAEYYKRKAADVTLARVPLFSFLTPTERRKIGEQLSSANFRKGNTIITEGEEGDCMYIIKSGQVGVYTTLMEEPGVSVIKMSQERLHLATLQEGDFFGEQALITQEPRSATIIALSDVQFLKFTKHDLALVVKQYPRVGTLLKKYHEQRISDTLESLKSIW